MLGKIAARDLLGGFVQDCQRDQFFADLFSGDKRYTEYRQHQQGDIYSCKAFYGGERVDCGLADCHDQIRAGKQILREDRPIAGIILFAIQAPFEMT